MLDWAARNTWVLLATAIALFMTKVTLLAINLTADISTGEALARRRVGTAWLGDAIRDYILGDRSSHRLDMVHCRTWLGRKISEHANPPAGRVQPRSLSTLRPTFSDYARGSCADGADIMAVVDRVFSITSIGISLQLGALACR